MARVPVSSNQHGSTFCIINFPVGLLWRVVLWCVNRVWSGQRFFGSRPRGTPWFCFFGGSDPQRVVDTIFKFLVSTDAVGVSKRGNYERIDFSVSTPGIRVRRATRGSAGGFSLQQRQQTGRHDDSRGGRNDCRSGRHDYGTHYRNNGDYHGSAKRSFGCFPRSGAANGNRNAGRIC